MTRKLWRKVAWTIPVAGVTLVGLVNCGGALPGGLGDKIPGGLPGSCSLDTSSIEAIEKFDFAGEFKLSGEVGAKLKAATVAAVALNTLNAQVDADLVTACGGLAKDLGASGDWKTGEEACNAAKAVIVEVTAKMKGSIAIDYAAPQCGVDIQAHADCSGHCDASVTPGSAKVECEPGHLQGTCDASCTGHCEMDAAAVCSGTCHGSCDAKFDGTCAGNCDGKCDGKNTTGQCNGKCVGKCDAHASGSCGGSCKGDCELKAEAKCSGTCSGKCSVDMKAPKCTGTVTPPKVSAECKAKCDAQVEAKASCTPGHVAIVVTNAADVALAGKFRTAVAVNLPKILKIAIGMKTQLEGVALGVKDAVVGVKAVAEAAAKSGGANGAMMAAKIGTCVGGTFDGAVKAAGSLTANVKVSASVSASASGKASL